MDVFPLRTVHGLNIHLPPCGFRCGSHGAENQDSYVGCYDTIHNGFSQVEFGGPVRILKDLVHLLDKSFPQPEQDRRRRPTGSSELVFTNTAQEPEQASWISWALQPSALTTSTPKLCNAWLLSESGFRVMARTLKLDAWSLSRECTTELP